MRYNFEDSHSFIFFVIRWEKKINFTLTQLSQNEPRMAKIKKYFKCFSSFTHATLFK